MQLMHIFKNVFFMGRMTIIALWPVIGALLILLFSTSRWRLLRPNESHFLWVVLIVFSMIVIGGICASQWHPIEGYVRTINRRSSLILFCLFLVRALLAIGVGLSITQIFWKTEKTAIILLSIIQIALVCVAWFSSEVVISDTWP